MPMPFQTSTIAIDMSAHAGSVSQPGPLIPTRRRVSLMSPSNGSISTLNVTPTPTVETRTGKKMVERR